MTFYKKIFGKCEELNSGKMYIWIVIVKFVQMRLTRFSGSQTINYILKEPLNKCFKNTFSDM